MEIKIDNCFSEITTDELIQLTGGGKVKVALEILKKIWDKFKPVLDIVGTLDLVTTVGTWIEGAFAPQGTIYYTNYTYQSEQEFGRYHCYNMCPYHN